MKLRARWLLPLLPLAVLLLMVVAPVVRLAWEGWSNNSPLSALGASHSFDPWRLWQDDYLRWRVLWSLAQAGITCVLALLFGVPIAWVLARFEFRGRQGVLRLLMLPFVVPTLVAAMGVLALWGPRGVLGVNLQDTPWLLLYGNLFFNLCLVVRAGVDALELVSAQRVAAARTLGATPWRAFWRVEWPAILPWLSSSLCLVFVYCFSGFGLALVLGGQRYATIEVEIYTLVAHELKLAEASVLAVWMLLLTGGVALLYAAMERRLATPSRLDPVARQRPRSAAQWLALTAALAVLLVVCAAPLLAIAWRALQAGSSAWAEVLQGEALAALFNTFRFSAMALVCATVLGVLHALAARQSVAWRAAAFLPFVVSPVTVAFGLLLLYPQWSASLPLLVGAYALLAFPFVAKSVASGLDSLPLHLTYAARTLGASPWRTFWRVTLPLVRPALRRGMAFAAATALGEFAVTLFLSRPEWTTLTTLIYQKLGQPGAQNKDAALVLACLLMLLAMLAFVVIEWPSRSLRTASAAPRQLDASGAK